MRTSPFRLVTGVCLSVALATAAAAQSPAPPRTAMLKSPTGADAGNAVAIAGSGGVMFRVEAKGLTPGWHGMHLHAKGACAEPKFDSAGAHINHAAPGAKPHGLLNPAGPDLGDLPNIYVGADGVGRTEVFTTQVRFADLTDADGTALVIHANADDHRSQPIGGAGDRVACGVIK